MHIDYKYRGVGYISLKEYRLLMAYKKRNINKINSILCRILFIAYMRKHITIKPNILRLKPVMSIGIFFFVSVISTRLEKTRFLWGFVVFVWKKLQWRLQNERCYEELYTCNYHLIVAKNTILLKLMINLIYHIRYVARMEMKCTHKKR